MKKTKKKKTRVGAIVYAVFMVLWALVLCYGVYFLWTSLMTFGEYWENGQIGPKVDAYMEKLDTEMWLNGENGLKRTISEMEHPYQTDDECVQVLREVLQDDIHCLPGVSEGSATRKIYDLFSGRSKFGQVYLTQHPFEPEENTLVNWAIENWALYPWEVEGVQFYLDGLYTDFELVVPESFTVLLNGHALTEANIVERGLPYDVLAEYYDEFDGLPTKVKYHADKIFGQVDYQLLDSNGQPAVIDPERDDSQFIEPVSEELYQRFDKFSGEFTERYLQFSSGAGQIWTDYARVRAYVLKGSDLDDRLDRTLHSYLEYMHNSNFNFDGSKLNGVKPLGNNIYILDISADAGSQMPAGYEEVHRDMYVFVQYLPGSNEVFAFSVEDYNTEESDVIG